MMSSFDQSTYKTDVIVPLARTQARALQQAVAEMKDPSTKRPSSLDLVFLYQITPTMADSDIVGRLNDVEVCWNNEFVKTRDPKRKSAAQFVRQLHELLEKRNPDLATQKWWAESVSEKQQAKLGVISKLADLLRHSPYAGLQAITPERLSSVAANDPAFSAFDETDLFTAATGAGLSVVDPVDIPPNPGVANYSALVEKLAEATDPTFVHAVFFNQPPASFAILGAGEGGRPFLLKAGGLRLDGATVIAAHAASGKGHGIEATARGKVLLPLKTAAAAGVDLHDLVVYHLADAARHRCRGGLLRLPTSISWTLV